VPPQSKSLALGRCQGWPSGLKPVFPEKQQAIDYAQNPACFCSGEIHILDSIGNLERTDCEDSRIPVYSGRENENSIACPVRGCVASVSGVWRANDVQGYRQRS
jgi:hypothetical protein